MKSVLGKGRTVTEDGRQMTDDKGYCIVLPDSAAACGERSRTVEPVEGIHVLQICFGRYRLNSRRST